MVDDLPDPLAASLIYLGGNLLLVCHPRCHAHRPAGRQPARAPHPPAGKTDLRRRRCNWLCQHPAGPRSHHPDSGLADGRANHDHQHPIAGFLLRNRHETLDRQRPRRRPIHAGAPADARILCPPAPDVPGVQVVTPARINSIQASCLVVNDPKPTTCSISKRSIRELSPDWRHGVYRQPGRLPGQLERLEQGEAIFISNVVGDRYNLHQGDQIILLTRRGEQPFTLRQR